MVCNIQSFPLFVFFLVAAFTVSSSAGKVRDVGGLSSYISGSRKSKTSIILISDVFETDTDPSWIADGYENPRLRALADEVAAAGFYAVLPDFFHGEPFIRGTNQTSWLIRHSPEKGFEDAKPLIEALKCKGITKIGIAGFCWGGKVAVLLSSSDDNNQAVVLLHPTYVEATDIMRIKVPVLILAGELDGATPPRKLKQFQDALNAMPQIDSFVKVFPGMRHGWTIRYNDTDTEIVKAAKESHNDMLHWMIKYLK